CANANPFANRREKFRFVGSKALQSRERAFRRARQSITRLANLFQGRDDEIESRLLHSGRSSKVLRTAANPLMMMSNGHAAFGLRLRSAPRTDRAAAAAATRRRPHDGLATGCANHRTSTV